jgi:hypothetical protein
MYHNQFSAQRRTYRAQNMINGNSSGKKRTSLGECFEHASSSTATASDGWLMHLELFDPHSRSPRRSASRSRSTPAGRARPRLAALRRVDELAAECEELRATTTR